MEASSPSAQLVAPKVGPSAPPSYIITHSASKKRSIGRLVRVATAFGVKEVCLVGCRRSNKPGGYSSNNQVTPKHFQNLRQCVQHLKEVEGCRVLGVETCEGAVPVQQHPFSGPTAFLLGNEGQGLSAKQMSLCDGFVYIPQHGPDTTSPDVAVAASIVLHHFAVWAEYPEREIFNSQVPKQPLPEIGQCAEQDSDDSLWQHCKELQLESPKPPGTPSVADSISSRSSSGAVPETPLSSVMHMWTNAAVLVVAVADYAGLCSLLLPSEMADIVSRMTSAFQRAASAYGAIKIETSSGVMSAAILPTSGAFNGCGFTEDGATAGLRLAALYRLGRMLLDVAATLPVPGTTTCLQLQMAISLGNLMGHSPATSVPTGPTGPSSSPPAMLYFGPLLAELLDLARRAPPMTIVAPDGEAAALRASGATADIRGPLFLEADDGNSTAGSVGGAPSSASGGCGSLVSRRLWLVEAHPLAYRYLPPQLRHGNAPSVRPAIPSRPPSGILEPSFDSLAEIFLSPAVNGDDNPQDPSSSSPPRAESVALDVDLDLDSASARADSQTSIKNKVSEGAGSIGDGSRGVKAPSIHSSRSSSCTGTCVTFSPMPAAERITRESSSLVASNRSASGSPSLAPGAPFPYTSSFTHGRQAPTLTLTLDPVPSSSNKGMMKYVPLLGIIARDGSGRGSLDSRPARSTGTGDSEESAASEPHLLALRSELAMMRQQLQALQSNAAAAGAAASGVVAARAAASRSGFQSAASLPQPAAGPGPIRRHLGASVLQHRALKSPVPRSGAPSPVASGHVADRYLSRESDKSEISAPVEKPAKKGSTIARLLFGKSFKQESD